MIALAGCRGERPAYSTEEVVEAFQRQGYTLAASQFPEESAAAREGHLLTPRGGQPFLVVVGSDGAVDDGWRDYSSQQTLDSFDARRANVLVISDSGLAPAQRERVLAALSSLPDRGAAVVVAGRE